jgi:hypothetical protein
MQNGLVSDFTKARYYSSVTLLYVLTLLFAFFIFRPFSGGAYSVAASGNLPVEIVKAQPAKQIITGKPLRIVIRSRKYIQTVEGFFTININQLMRLPQIILPSWIIKVLPS